ncbi:radical S-adenosyl methionine domain-containing protein 1 [Entomortierella lignicola]|nr:radical S-adenosyl methionine domain-containing protein 1 [Entomortierella lignicola]
MDDFSDVTELSFVVDSDEEDFDEEEDLEFIQGSQGSALVMDLNLNQPTNHQPVDQLTMSQDLDFQSQDQVLIRPRLGPAQANIPEPCPQNVETERKDVRRIWSKSVVVADTAERDEAVSRAKKEQESRIRCEQELANSRLAYEMLKSELAKLQKKHDREKAFKQKYRIELKRLNFKDPEKDITKRFSYVYYKPVNFPARTNLWYGKLVSHPLNSLEPATSELSIGDDFVDHVVLPRHRRPENDTGSIKDVKPVAVGHDEYVATLTDKDLEIFKWSERPEFLRLEDYETEDSDDDILGDIELYPKSTGGADKGKRRRTDDNGKPQSPEVVIVLPFILRILLEKNRMRILSSLGPLSKVASHLEPFSIYVHWPYCSSKCTYCNFNKYVDPRADHERMERSLLKELEAEIKYWGLDNKTRPLRSVYFGGLSNPTHESVSTYKYSLEEN